jgi:hypothetical protein
LKRFAFALALILAALLTTGPAFATTNGVSADHSHGVLLLLGSPAGAANCKAATTGAIRYNSTTPAIEFCNGTTWTALYQVQSTPAVTPPAGSGYFVLSSGTYNGNLGDLAGANATCLTELGTTHTGWMGYATANSNGQLIASKVKAFLCDSGGCNNLTASTTYYFANAGNAAAGGASFTTDASGLGPNDANNWNAANYFSGDYDYWLSRASTSNTQWANTKAGGTVFCSVAWSTSGANIGVIGNSSETNSIRWFGPQMGCGTAYHLICLVNP